MAHLSIDRPEIVLLDQSASTIISGGVHTTSHTTIHATAPRPSHREKRASSRGFANKIKRTTVNKTGSSVVADYSPLKEPDFEVCPILLNVDFYRGENAAEEQQYTPESNFSPSVDKWKGQRITLEQLHESLGKRRCRHASLVGGAGSGKTTLLKRYVGRLLNGNLSLKHGKQPSCVMPIRRRQRIYNVHFINVRDLPVGGTFTPCELLFKEMVKELSDEELNAGYQKLINQQEYWVFVIDGLDQYDWELENESIKIDYFTAATVPCVMFNLLCGELFPNAWVLTSSRQHKIRFFRDKLRADKIVVLNGLENEDIQRLANALPGSDNTVWERLSQRCPNLVMMCRTPLFLIFTVLVFILKTDFSIDTMAGVMTVFIQLFVESKYATNCQERSTLSKLKELAFTGTVKKRVIFREDDFSSVGLRSEEAQDLVIFAPRRTHILIRERLVSDDYVMFFCHQSVQETLAMLHISEMEVDKFKIFVESNINVPHFSVIRRLLCGFLLNNETYEATSSTFGVSDHEEKKVILSLLLRQTVETHLSTREYIELLSSLYETGAGADSLLDSHPSCVKISRVALTSTDVYVLARILGKMRTLENLDIWDTCLNKEMVNIIWNEIRESRLKIKAMDIHSNHKFDFDCQIVGKMIVHCETENLDINDCSLTDAKLEKMSSGQRTKLTKLNISRNEKIGVGGIEMIGNVVRNSENGFQELIIAKCNLTKKKIKGLHRSLGNTKIASLDINYNRTMGTQGAYIIGQIVEDSTVKTLDMSRCDQTAEEISAFARGLGGATMKTLDITTHELKKQVTKQYVNAISKLLPHVSDEMRMVDWRIDDKMRNLLQQRIETSAHSNFKLVYGHMGDSILTKEVNEQREI